jgi:hypothetical protein
LKTITILLSVLAIAAGMAVGWLEHEESRKAAATSRADQVIAAPAVLAPASGAPERRRRSWTPGESEIVSLEGESGTPPSPVSEPEVRNVPDRPGPGAPGESTGDPRLQAIALAIEKRSFTEAEKAARELAEGGDGEATAAVREAALRLAAKARVFDGLLKAIPAAPADPGASFEVLLANGATIRVIEVDETSARYVFKLPKGITFSPPREDVLEVRRAAGKPEARVEWKDLAARIASLGHPIDIFIGGVTPCFQNGFEKEGLALLEKLLARLDSDQVPLLFIPDAGEEALADWRLAAGRGRTGGGAPAAVAEKSAAQPAAEERSGPDAQILVQAAELLGEAQALYRAGAGKEGREEEVRQARERLDRALEILDPLPADHETVKKLRRQLAQLLSDVSRTASF